MGKPGPTEERRSYLHYARAAGVVSFILGFVFRLQHWPGSNAFIFVALGTVLVVLLTRIALGRISDHKEISKDLFALGGVALMGLRFLHYPGTSVALLVMVVGGLGVFWYERDYFLPGKAASDTRPWLFYPAFVLVIVGMLFRIQHWPYSTPLLIGGLLMLSVWFFSTSQKESKEE
jgi:drug/metabolite transporter (DMT)-like permease